MGTPLFWWNMLGALLIAWNAIGASFALKRRRYVTAMLCVAVATLIAAQLSLKGAV